MMLLDMYEKLDILKFCIFSYAYEKPVIIKGSTDNTVSIFTYHISARISLSFSLSALCLNS